VNHSSALGMFDQVVAASKGKQIVVFLDYDGTLSPIVDDPDAAYMSDTMRRAVRSVAKHFPTAIVSGRCRDKVFEFVKLAELYYAGSHGMDIKGPAKGSRHTKAAKVPIHPFQPLFLPLPHRLRPPERGKILILLLCPSVWLTGQRRSLSAGQPVPAHDRAGARFSGGKDQVHTWSQGGEQQVLCVCPLQMRR